MQKKKIFSSLWEKKRLKKLMLNDLIISANNLFIIPKHIRY